MRLVAMIAAMSLANVVGAQTIVAADYIEPTERYPHGILGDKIEHAGLQITLSDGTRRQAVWPDQVVFEDTHPRLADLDGDGAFEVITVESHEDFGARLAIWGTNHSGALAILATTDYIGRPFRWLAVAGAADMDGDGHIEIAYVDRPHLAKTLMVWRYLPQADGMGQLEFVAQQSGLTNHRIGERDIGGGMRVCADETDVITASADWTRVIATRLVAGALVTKDVGPHSGRASLTAALACN